MTHLTVERLDVVEPDGQLVLSLANSRRLPKPLIDGRTLDAAEKELAHVAAQRVFVGSTDETAAVRLSDRQGNERIRIYVDPAGNARIDFLDPAGALVDRIPR
jgi:catechol 2,3-dioxygenase-like lactoylglutathione lyase family enzyme